MDIKIRKTTTAIAITIPATPPRDKPFVEGCGLIVGATVGDDIVKIFLLGSMTTTRILTQSSFKQTQATIRCRYFVV